MQRDGGLAELGPAALGDAFLINGKSGSAFGNFLRILRSGLWNS